MKLLVKAALVAGALAVTTSAGFFAGRARADQPRMHAALDDLVAAQTELQAASGDKGGHRERAIDLTAQAIAEVHAGMDFARGY